MVKYVCLTKGEKTREIDFCAALESAAACNWTVGEVVTSASSTGSGGESVGGKRCQTGELNKMPHLPCSWPCLKYGR